MKWPLNANVYNMLEKCKILRGCYESKKCHASGVLYIMSTVHRGYYTSGVLCIRDAMDLRNDIHQGCLTSKLRTI